MKNLLVTGAAGFIGTNFCYYWAQNHPQDRLVVLDKLTYAGKRENLAKLEEAGKLEFVQGDICDQPLAESLLRDRKIDTLVHFAAESHVDRSITGPDAFIESNIVGTHSLLKAAKKVWMDEGHAPDIHRFHHVSTDEVYGSLTADAPAFTETTAYAPNSPYSASKAASDHLVRAYHHTFGLKVTTSSCSNNYGPYQDAEKLIPVIIGAVLNARKIPVYGDGKNIRDWLYVEDHCRAIDLILHKGRVGEVYNIGGENEWQNIDIVQLICDLIDRCFQEDASFQRRYPQALAWSGKSSRELIEFVTDRPGHDRRYAIDPAKCHAQLNYVPQESFETGIGRTISWYLDQG